MKRACLALAAVLLVAAASFAQGQSEPQQNQDQSQLQGRGRGGAPFAWNDSNKDGICDLTGQPVGQRQTGFGRGRRMWAAAGQAAGHAAPVYGRGRGGAPFAWNDSNKDGICDVTGQPVGQGRAIRNGGSRGRAGGFAWGDTDGDGVCDFTGRPVRTGRGGPGRNPAVQPKP